MLQDDVSTQLKLSHESRQGDDEDDIGSGDPEIILRGLKGNKNTGNLFTKSAMTVESTTSITESTIKEDQFYKELNYFKEKSKYLPC